MNVLTFLAKVPLGLSQLALAIPSLVNVFMEVMKALHEVDDYRERRERAKQLAAAIQDARVNKDTALLEALLKGSAAPVADAAAIEKAA
jgi:hypothetical protein